MIRYSAVARLLGILSLCLLTSLWSLAGANQCVSSASQCSQPTPHPGVRISGFYRAVNPQGRFSPTILAPHMFFTVTSSSVSVVSYDRYYTTCTACYSEPCSDMAGPLMRLCTPQIFDYLRSQVVSPTGWYDFVYAGRCVVLSSTHANGIAITRYSHGSAFFDALLSVLNRKAEAQQVWSWTRDRSVAGMLRRYYLFGSNNLSLGVMTRMQTYIDSATQGSPIVDAALPMPFEEVIIIVGDPLTREDLTSSECTLCSIVTALDDIKDLLEDFTATEFTAPNMPDGFKFRDYMRQHTPRLWSWYRLTTELVPALIPDYRSCSFISGDFVITLSTPVYWTDEYVKDETIQYEIPNTARAMAAVYGRLRDPNYGHLIPIMYTYAPRFNDVEGVQVVAFLNTCSPIVYYSFLLLRILSWVFITLWFARAVIRVMWEAIK